MNQANVKLRTYTSLTAFLEHYRTLDSLPARSADEENIFSAMKKLVGEIGAVPAAVLATPTPSESEQETSTNRRHRERAEIRLRRELAARGVLAG